MNKSVFELLAAIITILGGIFAFVKWGYSGFKKFLISFCCKIPKQTIKVIIQKNSLNSLHAFWGLGTLNGEPIMQVVCDCYITNISNIDIVIYEVSIKKPKIIGEITFRDSLHYIDKNYSIKPACTAEARVIFWIKPPICKKDESLIADIGFVNQFNNYHRVRKVRFNYV